MKLKLIFAGIAELLALLAAVTPVYSLTIGDYSQSVYLVSSTSEVTFILLLLALSPALLFLNKTKDSTTFKVGVGLGMAAAISAFYAFFAVAKDSSLNIGFGSIALLLYAVVLLAGIVIALKQELSE